VWWTLEKPGLAVGRIKASSFQSGRTNPYMFQGKRGMIKHKKVRLAGFPGGHQGLTFQNWCFMTAWCVVILAHGALSVSGATPFAICVIEEIGIYFLPSSV